MEKTENITCEELEATIDSGNTTYHIDIPTEASAAETPMLTVIFYVPGLSDEQRRRLASIYIAKQIDLKRSLIEIGREVGVDITRDWLTSMDPSGIEEKILQGAMERAKTIKQACTDARAPKTPYARILESINDGPRTGFIHCLDEKGGLREAPVLEAIFYEKGLSENDRLTLALTCIEKMAGAGCSRREILGIIEWLGLRNRGFAISTAAQDNSDGKKDGDAQEEVFLETFSVEMEKALRKKLNLIYPQISPRYDAWFEEQRSSIPRTISHGRLFTYMAIMLTLAGGGAYYYFNEINPEFLRRNKTPAVTLSKEDLADFKESLSRIELNESPPLHQPSIEKGPQPPQNREGQIGSETETTTLKTPLATAQQPEVPPLVPPAPLRIVQPETTTATIPIVIKVQRFGTAKPKIDIEKSKKQWEKNGWKFATSVDAKTGEKTIILRKEESGKKITIRIPTNSTVTEGQTAIEAQQTIE